MRVLFFGGTHARHLFFMRQLCTLDMEFSAIIMEREDLNPKAPLWAAEKDRVLFDFHFSERARVERKYFSKENPQEFLNMFPTLRVTPEDLNSESTLRFFRAQDPQAVVVFGSDLIRGQLLEALPKFSINLHLGLSPWYRGAATLFWPFYFLEPNYAGATFHQVIDSPDAGPILHQSIPDLLPDDGIHEVAARTVLTATSEFALILERFSAGKNFEFFPQRHQGKLFSRHDFKPAHLRLIYEEYGNELVREFLEGKLSQRTPRLVRAE